jgi:hypothetical protein
MPKEAGPAARRRLRFPSPNHNVKDLADANQGLRRRLLPGEPEFGEARFLIAPLRCVNDLFARTSCARLRGKAV